MLALPDVHRDVLVPEVEVLDRLQADGHLRAPAAWDAWDDARPDATDAADLRPEPSDEDAEKLAGRAPGARARDAWSRQEPHPSAPSEQRFLVAAPCTPDADRFAAQSCAAQAGP